MFARASRAIARDAARATRNNISRRSMSSGTSIEEEIGASRERFPRATARGANVPIERLSDSWARARERSRTRVERVGARTWVTDEGRERGVVAAEMNKWRSVSMLAIPACAGFGFYTLANANHSHNEHPAYSYLRVRNREQFPWGGDLGLFEYPKSDGHH